MIEPQSTGLLASLGISGWKFIAQLCNFSVVLFVMWKWVYTPLLAIMDKRAKEIQDGLTNAKVAEQRLHDASEEKERILKAARAEAHELLEDVKTRAEAVRQEKLAIAKTEIEKYIVEAKVQIKSERDAASASLKREVADLVVQATEKVVTGMDDAQKKSLVDHAVKHIAL